jgi:hypothetical protein
MTTYIKASNKDLAEVCMKALKETYNMYEFPRTPPEDVHIT